MSISNVTVSRNPPKLLSIDQMNPVNTSSVEPNPLDKISSVSSVNSFPSENNQNTLTSSDDITLCMNTTPSSSHEKQNETMNYGHATLSRTSTQHNHTIDCLNDFKYNDVPKMPVSAEWAGTPSSKDTPTENGEISFEAKGAKPKTRGKYRKLVRSVTTESYQHAMRKQLLEEQLYQIGLEVHEECEEKDLDSGTAPSGEQGEFEYFANIESDASNGIKRTTTGSTKASKNDFRHEKLLDDESEFSSNRNRQSRKLLRLPSFSKKTRYSRLTKSDSVNSIDEGLRSGRYRAPLKKSYSTSDAYDEEKDIDVDEDKVLAQYYSPFCPRRMAICPHMNIPEMKQLETYLVLTRLKQFCFI